MFVWCCFSQTRTDHTDHTKEKVYLYETLLGFGSVWRDVKFIINVCVLMAHLDGMRLQVLCSFGFFAVLKLFICVQSLPYAVIQIHFNIINSGYKVKLSLFIQLKNMHIDKFKNVSIDLIILKRMAAY